MSFEESKYRCSRFREDSKAETEDNTYLTASNLFKIAGMGTGKGLIRLISGSDVQPKKTEARRPVISDAIENFDEFINRLAGDDEKAEEVKKAIFGFSFDETLAFVQNQLDEIKGTNNDSRKKLINLRKEYDNLISELIGLFESRYKELLEYCLTNESAEKQIIVEKIEEIREMHQMIAKSFGVFDEKSDQETQFLRIKRFLAPSDKFMPIENRVENAKILFESIHLNYSQTVKSLNLFFARMGDSSFEKIGKEMEKMKVKYIDLFRIGKGEEFAENMEKIFDETAKGCVNPDPIYSEDLQGRKEYKLKIFVGLQKLFDDFVTNPIPEKIATISRLLDSMTPNVPNELPLQIRTVPSTFISDAEIRALRLLLVSSFASRENARESFKAEELKVIIETEKKLSFYSTSLTVLNNQLISLMNKAGVFEDEKMRDLFMEELLTLEHGLIVRNIDDGFSLSDYDNERFHDEEGRFVWIQSEGQRKPNYEMKLMDHSERGNPELFRLRRVGDLSPSVTLKDYTTLFMQDGQDDIEDLSLVGDEQVNALFQNQNLDYFISELNRQIELIDKEEVDQRYELLNIFMKIWEVINNGRTKEIKRLCDDHGENSPKQIFDALDFESILRNLQFDIKKHYKEAQRSEKLLRLEHIFKDLFPENTDKLKELMVFIEELPFDFHIFNMVDTKKIKGNFEEPSVEQLKNIFEAINKLEGFLLLFSGVEISCLRFYMLHKYFRNNEGGLISEWQQKNISELYDAQKQYEELLATLIPYMDKLKKYLTSTVKDESMLASLLKELGLVEWGISGRYSHIKKETEPDTDLIAFRETYSSLLTRDRLWEEEEKKIREEEAAEQEAYEKALAEQAEEHRKRMEDLRREIANNNLIKFGILPVAVTLMIASSVLYMIKKTTEEEAVDSEKPVESLKEAFNEEPETLEQKYRKGEIIYLSMDEKDDFGFKVMSSFWAGITSVEEAKVYFESLSSDKKAQLNIALSDIINSVIGKKTDIETARKEIEQLI